MVSISAVSPVISQYYMSCEYCGQYFVLCEYCVLGCIFSDIVNSIDLSKFDDKLVVIKGCSKKNIPLNAYSQLINRLKPVAKRIMFGEACSTVPLYKKK